MTMIRGGSRSRSRNLSGAGAGNFKNGRLRQPCLSLVLVGTGTGTWYSILTVSVLFYDDMIGWFMLYQNMKLFSTGTVQQNKSAIRRYRHHTVDIFVLENPLGRTGT